MNNFRKTTFWGYILGLMFVLQNFAFIKIASSQTDPYFPDLQVMPTTPETCFEFKDGVILDYTCQDQEVQIPRTINGVNVTVIGAHSFEKKNLTLIKTRQPPYSGHI